MHWNVAPDELPGSATLVYVLDRLLNDSIHMCVCVVSDTLNANKFCMLQLQRTLAKIIFLVSLKLEVIR